MLIVGTMGVPTSPAEDAGCDAIAGDEAPIGGMERLPIGGMERLPMDGRGRPSSFEVAD